MSAASRGTCVVVLAVGLQSPLRPCRKGKEQQTEGDKNFLHRFRIWRKNKEKSSKIAIDAIFSLIL